MEKLKTKLNDQHVEGFLNGLTDAQQRQDCLAVVELMRDVTRAEPKMWGGSM